MIGRERRKSRWTSVAASLELLRRYREDWARTPRSAKERWFLTTAVGLALNSLLSAALVGLTRGWGRDGRLGWEREALRFLETELPLSFGHAIVLQEVGSPMMLVTLTVMSTAAAVWVGRPLRALTVVAAFFMLNPVILLGWELWDRARPTVVAGGIASPGGLHAFPSGHVAHTVAVYGLLISLWIRASGSVVERLLAALLLLALVAAVGIARMRMGVHWPTDVLAGVLLGAVWLAVLLVALPEQKE